MGLFSLSPDLESDPRFPPDQSHLEGCREAPCGRGGPEPEVI